MKLLNFGSLNIDNVYQVEHFVRSQETISSAKLDVFCGGKGLNQSIALAKSGASGYHAGAINKNDKFLLIALEETGVNTEYIEKRDNIRSGHAIIQVDQNGQNCILLYGGANKSITKEQIDSTLNQFAKGDYLILQNEINLMDYLMEKAIQIGMRIVLNPSPMGESILKLPIKDLDILILNEVEATEICGEYASEETLEKLHGSFPKVKIVLTLGKNGVLYQDENQKLRQGIYRVETIDTTAAGDTFSGYFIGSMIMGKPVKEALEIASKAAAITVSRIGAGSSIPYMYEVENSNLELA